jgi:signal transduction histidine kinase
MRVKNTFQNLYKRIGFHRSLRSELVLFFLIVLMIPLVGVSLLVLTQMQNALREQMANKLIAVRQLKAIQVEEYFQTVNRDISFSAQLPTIVQAVQEFEEADDDLFAVRRLGYLGKPDLAHSDNNNKYDVVHARYFGFFQNIITTKGYYDIYLIGSDGDIVYNYDKGDDFATNLLSGPYSKTILAELFHELQKSSNSAIVKISDFVIYGPSGGAPASFAGAPIVKDGKNIGVLIFQLPVDQVNALLEDRTGLGETGETYLVGADKLMRSDSRFQTDSSILKQEVNTVAVQNALAGKSGVAEIDGYRGALTFSAYQPISIGNLKWALIAEVDPEEFFAPANTLRSVVLGIIALASLVIASLGFLIANQVVRPIRALTVSAQQIGAGNLFTKVAETGRQDEIGVLARAFHQMQSELSAIYSNLEQRVADRTRDLNIASDVSRRITRVLDMEELLSQLVEQTKEGFNLYAASVYLHQLETGELTLEATTGESERQMKKALTAISIEARPSLVAQAAREQKRVVINDVSQSKDYLVDPSLPDAKAEAVFPMVIGTHLVGVLDLISEKADRFGETDIQILNSLAEQIGIAVRNAQLYSVQVEAAVELRRADEMKTQFHSSVSHELRTPLNAIINYVEMVIGGLVGSITEEQRELLNHSLESSKHLLSLINDILDMSKIQAGKMTLFVEDDVNLYEILDLVIGDAATMLKDRPVKFAMDIDRDLPILSCDKRRIRQILLNLLSNANKFTEEGTVTLIAKNKGDHILFSISDTGAGIPPKLQSIIFEPYVQTLDGAKKEQGTGLGLPISRSFAQAHGGDLWVESMMGKGSIFFFSLPVRHGAENKN